MTLAMPGDFAPDSVLTLWERALARPPHARADALLDDPGERAAPRTLGQRNLKLLVLHAQLFGRELELLSHCPSCATVVEFTADCDALAKLPGSEDASSHRLDIQGHVIDFRLPRSADVIAASDASTEGDFARALLQRCILSSTRDCTAVPIDSLTMPVLDAISRRMESLDPAASVSFGLGCPECATRWDALLDIGELVWQKVRAAAERVLLEVDALARAYGWTEAEVLRLHPTRRAAYLQMGAS